MSDIEIEIEVVPGVWLVHARWAGEGRWFWQCRNCPDSFGPLTTREGAEAGARAHRHRADPATKAAGWTLSIIRGDAGPDAYGYELGSSPLDDLDLGEETWAWLDAHGYARPEAGHSEPYQLTWVLVTPAGVRAGELTNLVAQRHWSYPPATKTAPPGATNAGRGLDPTPSSRRSGTS